MFYVKEALSCHYEVKKSTFTSYLVPFDLFDFYHDKLKKEHPKANHIVFAYRHLNAYQQIEERASDDNEPKGVAGIPTLNVLRGENFINTALFTVRYFGGTKLGTGGMVRAYTQSAKAVTAQVTRFVYETKHPFTFTTPYPLVKRYEHFLDKHTIPYHDRVFESDCVRWHLALSQQQLDLLKQFMQTV